MEKQHFNILILRPNLDVGGASQHISLLSKGLLQKRHNIHCVFSNADTYNYLSDLAVSIHQTRLHPSTITIFLQGFFSIIHLCIKNRIDILHSHHRFTSIIARFVSFFLGVPLVVTLHEFHDDWKILARYWTGDITLVPSESLKKHLIGYYGIKPERIISIFNGIEQQPTNLEIPFDIKGEYRLSGVKRIGFVGRFSPEKGIRYLVESIPMVLAEHENVEFFFIGEGALEAEIRQLVMELEISPKTHFFGYRPNPDWFYTYLDLLVIPSLSESFGLVAVEAMRVKCPIIATNVGGSKEVVQDGVTGILIPSRSPCHIADAINKLLLEEEKLTELGEAGYKHFLENFCLENMVDEVEKKYWYILSKDRRRFRLFKWRSN